MQSSVEIKLGEEGGETFCNNLVMTMAVLVVKRKFLKPNIYVFLITFLTSRILMANKQTTYFTYKIKTNFHQNFLNVKR